MKTTGREHRLRKKALFQALGYRPDPGQALVHRSKAPRRLLACGVRWGKSTCAAMEAAAALLAPAETTTGWIVAPTYDLTDRIFKRVLSILKAKMPHRIREQSPRDHSLVVINLGGGLSELRAKSADNPVSLLGEALDFVIVDEAAHLKREVWENFLSQRLLDRQGWALLLSTPRGRDFFYSLFRRGQKGRDPSFESWSSPTSANPHLDPATIERERLALPEETFAEQYLAQFVGESDEPCDTCGGPSAEVSGCVLLVDDEVLAACEECGHEVDASERTVVRRWDDGQPSLCIVRAVNVEPADLATLRETWG